MVQQQHAQRFQFTFRLFKHSLALYWGGAGHIGMNDIAILLRKPGNAGGEGVDGCIWHKTFWKKTPRTAMAAKRYVMRRRFNVF